VSGAALRPSGAVADNRGVRKIGHIVGLQVQRSTLKLPSPPGRANKRHYDPAALVRVAHLELSPDGVVGMVDPGDRVVDVHHQHHPSSKNVRNENGLSVGFTAHYARMRAQFGAHLVDGIAGENVLVAADAQIELEQLLDGLDITLQGGGAVHLERVSVAEPCVEFTRYALGLDPAEPGDAACTAGLRFLRNGMRGFYVCYAGAPVVLRAGDVVFASS